MANRRHTSTRRGAGSPGGAAAAVRRSGAREATPAFASRATWWLPVLLVLLVAAVYGNSLHGPFVFDDQLSIVENRSIRDLGGWRALLQPERELPVAGRPVVNVTLALNYAVHGLSVTGYHLVNVAIHAACALLAFGIVRRTIERTVTAGPWQSAATPVAFATAAIWAVHPLNSEAVNYVTQRTELLMACFYLATVYAVLRSAGDGHRIAWSAAAVSACALGAGCKESMATTPIAVLIYDRIFLSATWRDVWRTRGPLHLGLFASWGVLAILAASGPRIHSAGFSLGVSPWTYLLNQAGMIVRYLRLAVWPSGLVLNYGAPVPLSLPEVWLQGLAVVLLLAVTITALLRRPAFGYLGAWFFITLAPTSSILPIVTEVGAERRMYLPLLALAAGVALGAWRLLAAGPPQVSDGPPAAQDARGTHAATAEVDAGRRRREWGGGLAMPVAIAAIVIALGLATAARNREYGSALSLAETTFERWPTPETRHMYASELSLAGREVEALEELKASVGGFPRANYNLGIALFRQKAYPEAIAAFDAFVKAYPSLLEVVEARVLTGRSHAELGHWTEAAQAYDDALRMRPSRREIHGLLADALVQLDRDEEAIPHYRTFLDAFPDDTGALGTLGVLLMERERFKEAIPVFRRVVDIDPKNAIARRNLATALLAESDAAGAVEQARLAASLSPDDALSLDLLGLALIERGLPSEAVLAFRRANQLAPADPVIHEHLGAAEALVAAGGQRPPAGR